MKPAHSLALPAPVAPTAPLPRRVRLLSAAFALFNSLRIVAYLPTLFALHDSAKTDQHSLFTWLTFLGANLTMAMWLHEQNGRRWNRAIAVNACNAFMCAAIVASIAWLRWMPPGDALRMLLLR